MEAIWREGRVMEDETGRESMVGVRREQQEGMYGGWEWRREGVRSVEGDNDGRHARLPRW